MSVKVNVKPEVVRWARERAALEPEELARKLGLRQKWVDEWEKTGELTLAHLERLAEKTHVPIGFLFLLEPPSLRLPIADFRSHAGVEPSPDLLETLYQCELRQSWYREHIATAADELEFVGSAASNTPIATVAESIREKIGLDVGQRARLGTWEDALRDLFEKVEDAGILAMRNGIVGNNTHRPLSVQEFRGFTLSDRFAPLIFVNAADSKSAQMFTVVHELVHVWRGESGVSDVAQRTEGAQERFCNQVAAEVLIPMRDFVLEWQNSDDDVGEIQRLARFFKVSTLVVLIRAKEAGAIALDEFDELYNSLSSLSDRTSGKGGDFYRTQRSRLGKRFASAVIASAVEGHTPYTEAFQLLGFRKLETFNELGRNLGVIL
jgi:Zn-dependent peptidase ImmA (M78 family)/transcriptional regulator with XRE-family HTH domain